MGCCGGGNNYDNRVKNWGTETKEEQTRSNINPVLIILGIVVIGLIVYKYFI